MAIVLCLALVSAGSTAAPQTVFPGEKHVRFTFTPRLDPAEDVLDLDLVPGFPWRPGLSHHPTNGGDLPFGALPLFAFPVLRRGKPALPGERALCFSLKGVWSGAETTRSIPVAPGSRFRFTVKVRAVGLERSGFRFGVFWEDDRGEPAPLGTEAPVVFSPFLRGSFPLTEKLLTGRVPPGVSAARPFFFLKGDPEELSGDVCITEAGFSTGPALDLRFSGRLLVFPEDDPVPWRLTTLNLASGTYFLSVNLRSSDGGVNYGRLSFNPVTTDGQQVRFSGTLEDLCRGKGGLRVIPGGLYEVASALSDASEAHLYDALRVRIGRIGKAGDLFAGELRRFIPCFSVADLTRLEENGVLGALAEDLPIYYAAVKLSKKDFLAPPSRVRKILERLPHVSWFGSVGAEDLPEDPEEFARWLAPVSGIVSEWEIVGAKISATYLAAARAAVEKKKGAQPVRFGRRDAFFSGADFVTRAMGASRRAADGTRRGGSAENALWVVVDSNSRDVVGSILRALSGGGDAVFLPRALEVLLQEGPSGFSPTSLYGPWRTLQRMIGGAVFVGAVPVIPGAETLCFRRSERTIVVVRSRRGPLKARIAALKPVTEIDAWGNRRTHPVTDGYAEIQLSRELTFLLDLSLGYDETVDSLEIYGTEPTADGGRISFGVRNLAGADARLSVEEVAGGFRVTVPLSPTGVTTFDLAVDPAAVSRLRREKSSVFRVSLYLGGKKTYEKERTLRVFWGKRRFRLSRYELTRRNFRFDLEYLGEVKRRAYVFVTTTEPGSQEVIANWSGIGFSPGKTVKFEGRLFQPAGELKVIILLEGAEEPEDFLIRAPGTSSTAEILPGRTGDRGK